MTTEVGVTASEFLEREAGSDWHRALLIAELQSNAEAAWMEFKESADPQDQEYAALCERLANWEPRDFA